MANTTLQGMRVAILATDDFVQSELTEPKKALEKAGAKVLIVAPQSGEIQGMNHDEKADRFPVDRTLAETTPEEFDAVLLPGGAINADTLRVVPEAKAFITQIDQAGKPIAVICHGSWLLVSTGLVRGRKITSYHTIQDDLRNAGAQWHDAEVVRDRNWVSSRQPSDLPAFNRKMLALFSEHQAGWTARGLGAHLAVPITPVTSGSPRQSEHWVTRWLRRGFMRSTENRRAEIRPAGSAWNPETWQREGPRSAKSFVNKVAHPLFLPRRFDVA